MRNDTDIRKEAYRRILKRELCWWLVAIAGGLLLAGVFSGSGIVNLFLHGFQGIGSCWAGIICLVVTGYIAYSLLGILREKRKLIGAWHPGRSRRHGHPERDRCRGRRRGFRGSL